MSLSQTQTIRQALQQLLLHQERSLRELSQLLSLSEKDILPHLEHLAKHPGVGRRFVITPAHCRQCGFIFAKRRRVAAPSRCPRCRQTDLARPRYAIQAAPQKTRQTPAEGG
jgi:predicted Zn-ribbon and HTH transcriptional regulator